MNLIKNFIKDEQGLELSEYAVMCALIILLILAAITGLSSAISGAFQDTTAVINQR
jgi:Flp pilus assembly pilin Flp